MVSTTLPKMQHYEPGPPTEANLEYADLSVIDFSKADTEEGRAELADQVKKGLRDYGFLYIVNHGYTQEDTTHMFDLANVPFSCVTDDEKRKYATKMFETGREIGFKMRSMWATGDGIPDQIEQYCYHPEMDTFEHPEGIRPVLPQINKLHKFNHFDVLHTILRLIARSLELPEYTLVNKHKWDVRSDSAVKFLKYYPTTEERATDILLNGHTDYGTITILWSQPIAGLQIQTAEGEWRWIRHIDNAIVVNVADALEFLTGGYYKATRHRVVVPPEDQRKYSRLGSYYFARANDDVKLMPMDESPVLQREGMQKYWGDGNAPTMLQWGRDRTKVFGKKGVDGATINGVAVGYY